MRAWRPCHLPMPSLRPYGRWASPSSSASTAIVALLRDPLGRPSGLPLRPALYGRPRCFFAVFSAGGRVSMASMLGVMSSSSPEFDDMLHLLFRRVARPAVPAALRGGLRNPGDTSVEACAGNFSGNGASTDQGNRLLGPQNACLAEALPQEIA